MVTKITIFTAQARPHHYGNYGMQYIQLYHITILTLPGYALYQNQKQKYTQ